MTQGWVGSDEWPPVVAKNEWNGEDWFAGQEMSQGWPESDRGLCVSHPSSLPREGVSASAGHRVSWYRGAANFKKVKKQLRKEQNTFFYCLSKNYHKKNTEKCRTKKGLVYLYCRILVFYRICGICIEGMAIETEISVEETWFQNPEWFHSNYGKYVCIPPSQNPITQIK